jgi:hypothetical protein
MRSFITGAAALLAVLATGPRASAVVVPDADHIYAPLLLSDFTQGCVQSGPGGTFVGQGPGFTGNAQSIVFVTESGDESVVATGFNAISDCEYDVVIDTLYVTDNSLEAVGAVTGDTIFAIADASTAPGVTALGNELVPAGSLPFAAGLALDSVGQIFVANANGGGTGSVQQVSGGALVPFIPTGLDFVGSIVFDAGGDLVVVETLAGFDAEVTRYDDAGAFVDSVAGPSFGFGSYDIAMDVDGRLLVSGAFGGDVVSMSASDGATTAFASGLTFATGMDVDVFTGRVSLLSATFVPTDEDSSLHRFVAKDRLVTGNGSEKTDCTSEVYGLELVPQKPGKPAKQAICVDGAVCDSDGRENDVCVFPVGFCLRVSDSRLPECAPTDVASFTLMKSKPESAVLTALSATVAAATPITEESCFFSDGIEVPVKITNSGAKKDGKSTFKTQAVGSGTKPPKDTDSVKLVCRPAGA